MSFNLSDKITIQDEIGDDELYNTLYEYQVKEFIRLLKRGNDGFNGLEKAGLKITLKDRNEFIDKLAGKRLVEE